MFQGMTKMVKALFYANIFAFILTLIFQGPIIQNLACYNYRYPEFHWYQPFTSMFLHGGIMHIMFNMFALCSIGTYVESYLGSRRFLLYYLICGLCGAFLFMFMSTANVPSIGASGAIYGIVLMFALLFPEEKLFFFFIPIGIKAKYLISVLFLIEVVMGFTAGPSDNVAHFAHVGGGLAGLALMGIDRFLPKSKFI